MKYYLFLLIDILLAKTAVTQGSGYALRFVGNNYVQVLSSPSITIANTITVEAWINIANPYNNNTIVQNYSPTAGGFILGTELNDGNIYNITFRILNKTGSTFTQRSTFANGYSVMGLLQPNKWCHIAATYDGATAKIYVNGVLLGSNTGSALPLTASGGDMFIGDNTNMFSTDKQIDEVKVWNIALTETQVRERMCVKIATTDPLFGNLKAYYKFDYVTNTTPDASGNNNTGTLFTPAKLISGAPIGDYGIYSYDATANYYCTITNPYRGDKFNATLTSSTATTANGIHIYGVNSFPNTLSGTIGVGSNNAYYGVFVANNNSAVYNAGYSFQSLEPTLPTNLNDLRLYKRTNNAATTWADANATFVGTSCNAYGQNTEYILGSIGSVLPIQLLKFYGNAFSTNNILYWQIANEINVQKYSIERSTNKTQWTTIANVNAQFKNQYKFIDDKLTASTPYYYRIKIITNANEHTYSQVLYLADSKNVNAALLPNSTINNINLYITNHALLNTTARIVNSAGQIVQQVAIKNKTTPINVTHLPPQVYWLQLSTGEVLKLIRQ